MSRATDLELEDLYSAIEESARLIDVPCSRDRVFPFLAAYRDEIARAVIAFRVATDARHAGEFNCHVLALPKDVDPYAVALSNGLITGTDHPVGTLLSDVERQCPIDSYGFDFGIVGGFQKTWSFFPADDFQNLSKIADIPSMPPSLAENVSFFADRGLSDKVSLIGIDYRSKTANVYFGELPDECLEPKSVLSMHRELGLPDPSERMMQLGQQAFGLYVTLNWDSPKIQRISFSVMTQNPMSLPIQLDPKIERFARTVRYGANSPKIVYAAMTSAGEEYCKFQAYFRWRTQVLELMQLSDSGEESA